jgi:pilus assembly protein CpaB
MARTLTQPGPDRTNRLIFIGAVGLALLAAVLVFAALANFGGGDGDPITGDTVDVVVASQDIGPGDEINADMVELATLPVNALIDDAYTDEALIVGTKAKVAVARGDQLAPSKVVGAGSDADGASYIIPNGMRAMSVSVSEETSVGGLLLPGDRVDLMISVEEEAAEGASTGLKYGLLLLQDVEILAVAQETLRPVSRVDVNGDPLEDGVATRDEDVEEDPDAATVTLALTPEEATILAGVQVEATIYLSLRAPGDRSRTDNTEIILPEGNAR